jgi:hypothetical protein
MQLGSIADLQLQFKSNSLEQKRKISKEIEIERKYGAEILDVEVSDTDGAPSVSMPSETEEDNINSFSLSIDGNPEDGSISLGSICSCSCSSSSTEFVDEPQAGPIRN